MAAIRYTALRSIERLPFEILSAIDISTTANNINSTTTDLSGLNTGGWILIAGFTDATLNVWHQLTGNSTATTIPVVNTINVTDAGDNVSIVGYVRGKNTSYRFDLILQKDDRKKEVTKKVSVSLSGRTETITHRRQEYFILTTDYLNEKKYKQVIEFLDSCESDEYFIFDRIGTVATSDNPLMARIVSKGYTEKRISNPLRQISFEVVIV